MSSAPGINADSILAHDKGYIDTAGFYRLDNIFVTVGPPILVV